MIEWEPVEGGWGYMVALGLSLVYSVTMVPLYAFGLLFADFLPTMGNATFATTLSNGIYNTMLSFTGLAANILLQKYSTRKVAALGTIFYFIGSFGIVFTKTLAQFVFFYGVIQGLGFGLLMPAAFTSFNAYFMRKKNFVMALCQAGIVSVTLAWPTITEQLLEVYDWRGVQCIFAALSLNCFLAALCFHPIEWHSIRRIQTSNDDSAPTEINKITSEIEVLLEKQAERKLPHEETSPDSIISDGNLTFPKNFAFRRNRQRSTSSPNGNATRQLCDSLDLFTDWRYLNMAFGLSFSYTSDFMFISMLPLLAANKGRNNDEATLIMTIYFSFDLICNLFLPILNYLVQIKNRYLFLGGTVLSALFRIALTLGDSYTWLCVNVGVLGFLRSFIQTPLPLVVAETYGERFTSAFSLYMVVCGFVTLIYGPLTGLIKFMTGSDELVQHMLTLLYVLCAITWSVEMCFFPANKAPRKCNTIKISKNLI